MVELPNTILARVQYRPDLERFCTLITLRSYSPSRHYQIARLKTQRCPTGRAADVAQLRELSGVFDTVILVGGNAADARALGRLFRVISKMNESSLHAALLENRLDLARSLIQQGADVNAPDDYGKTPLFLAAEFPEITELLLNAGAEVNIHDKEGETPLHEVAEDGTVIQCRMLLGHGANVNAEDRRKQTSLHVAAAYGQYEVAELLIEQGADVNHRDVNGKAPLHYAVHGNIMPHELDAHLKIAEALISAGADLQARTNNNETPLELAKQHFGYPELATLLVRHGAK